MKYINLHISEKCKKERKLKTYHFQSNNRWNLNGNGNINWLFALD